MKRRGKSTQGSTSGTLLQTVNTCYNGAASPCTSTAITLPITQWSVTNQLGNTSGTSKVAFTYNSFGLVTEEDDYDFGASTPIKKTVISYASLGNGIVGMPSSVKIQDGGGNTKAETDINYDETSVSANIGATPQHVAVSGSRGNATTIKRLAQGTTFISSTLTYFGSGIIHTASDPLGEEPSRR